MVTSELKGGEWKSGKGVNIQNLKVIDFTQYRDDDDKRLTRKRSKKRLKGSVLRSQR
jgi:hypothetical protein